MEQDAFDIYKVPAFQRRSSIEARARKLTKPEAKRIVVPAARVEPFPAFENESPQYARGGYSPPSPMPQVIDRRAVARAAEKFFNEEKKLYVRDMATKAAERFAPSSVPRTLVQKMKERMAKDEEYSHNLWGDEPEEDMYASASATRRMKCVGIVTHYFEKINVCVVDLIDSLELGHRLIFEEEDYYLSEQMLESMQINRQDVNRATKGQQIGVKVQFIPKLGGKVWKVIV